MINLAGYYDKNMERLQTPSLFTTRLDIPSTSFENRWIGGEDGISAINVGADPQPKIIEATIELISSDYLDYQLLRDYLYGIFGFDKLVYIVDKRQSSKRHGVVLESDFIPTRHSLINGTATVPFITAKSPFAESIGTTQGIHTDGINNNLWGPGMGLIDDSGSLVYTHEGTSFDIYNAGNVPVHPFQQDLKITIDNVIGSTEFLELKNITNGTTFKINESVTSAQEIILDGPNITSNGLQFLRHTNKQFITLEPGWNEFEITGVTSAEVAFDFRFYYL